VQPLRDDFLAFVSSLEPVGSRVGMQPEQ